MIIKRSWVCFSLMIFIIFQAFLHQARILFSLDLGFCQRSVGKALKYNKNLHPSVQNLVNVGLLKYEVAYIMTEYNERFTGIKENYNDEQLIWQIEPSIKSVLRDYSESNLRNNLEQTLKEKSQISFLTPDDEQGFNDQVKSMIRLDFNRSLNGLASIIRNDMDPEQIKNIMKNRYIKKAFYQMNDTLNAFLDYAT